MSSVAIANPTVIVNNNTVAIVPNSAKFKEGFGEQNLRTASSGGNSVQTVYSDNIETKMSGVTFEVFNTADNIALLRTWKLNKNKNAVSITGDGLSRTFQSCAFISDYEVNLGSDTTIEVEFKGDPAV